MAAGAPLLSATPHVQISEVRRPLISGLKTCHCANEALGSQHHCIILTLIRGAERGAQQPRQIEDQKGSVDHQGVKGCITMGTQDTRQSQLRNLLFATANSGRDATLPVLVDP